MNRRQFLATTGGGVLGVGLLDSYAASTLGETGPGAAFLLSAQGCGRATGYAEANKIVTLGDRTHVVWLDSPAEGFRVRVRTLNRATEKWSSTWTVGVGFDNHGGPALTVDSEGYLHIASFPHHHAFRYRRSKRPNDASEWGEEIQFGEKLTYPTLVCGPDNTLYFTARRGFREKLWEVEFWSKKPGQDWSRNGAILRSRHKGYAHFQESLAWGPDHRTLHLCCRFHENSDRNAYGRLQTVAYIKTEDFGKTWRRSDGAKIQTPASVDKIEVLAEGGVDREVGLRAGCMARLSFKRRRRANPPGDIAVTNHCGLSGTRMAAHGSSTLRAAGPKSITLAAKHRAGHRVQQGPRTARHHLHIGRARRKEHL